MTKVLCCPEDRQAVIVTMRPRNSRDAWFVEGAIIEYRGRLPSGEARFMVKLPETENPEVATLAPMGRMSLPADASFAFLRFSGTRVKLAICYKAGMKACRASSVAK